MEQVKYDIFQNYDFVKDLYKYNLFGNLLKRVGYEVNTDNENYCIISFDTADNDVWLWTKDDINEELLKDVIKSLPDYGKIVYKAHISNFMDHNIDVINNSKEEFGCYMCKEPIKPDKELTCNFEIASLLDQDELTDLWLKNHKESDKDYIINDETRNQASDYIEKWLKVNGLYLLRDVTNNKIICFASIQNVPEIGCSKIAMAYTREEYRSSGYMKKLIYEMTNIVLNNNLIPVLQTDINYIPSNKSYQNVGYVLDGTMIQANYEKKYKMSL